MRITNAEATGERNNGRELSRLAALLSSSVLSPFGRTTLCKNPPCVCVCVCACARAAFVFANTTAISVVAPPSRKEKKDEKGVVGKYKKEEKKER